MAEVETVLFTRLSGYAGLSALVGARIYPLLLPQNPTLPAVTYQRISGTREMGMAADHGMAHPTFQIDAWATTYASAKSVATQIRAALRRWSDTTTNPEILDVLADDDRDLYEDETRLYRVSADYIVWHRE